MGQTASVKRVVRKLKTQKKGPVVRTDRNSYETSQQSRNALHVFATRPHCDGTIVNMFDSIRQWLIFDNSITPGHPHNRSQSFNACTAKASESRALPTRTSARSP